MKIETKFNIGDELKLCSGTTFKVEKILFESSRIYYAMSGSSCWQDEQSLELCPKKITITKEEIEKAFEKVAFNMSVNAKDYSVFENLIEELGL